MNLAELKNHALSFDRAVLMDVRVGNNMQPEKDARAVWNIDSNHRCAFVSDHYNLVQHHHVVNEVVEALINLNIPTTVSAVRNGRDRVLIDLSFPSQKIGVKVGEEFFTGIRIVNSYDKTTGIMILPQLMRLACKNGMVVNVGWVREFNVIHSNKLASDFAKIIPEMIAAMVERSDKFKTMVENCIGDSIEWELMDKIIAKLCTGRQKHIKAIQEILKRDCKAEKPSRWDVYNAFTNYATHGQQIKPSIETWLQDKAQIALVTPLAQLVPTSNGVEA
jgi:hypothetical protein